MNKELPTTNCGKLPEKDFALDEKIREDDWGLDIISTKDVAQKIQEAKKELKINLIHSTAINRIEEMNDIVNKLFSEKFGTLAGDEK